VVYLEYLSHLEQYDLTKAERLMLLNLRPTSEVELFLIIEEVSERLSEEERASLVEETARIFENKD
jgi:hypothetical protein